MHGCRNDLLQSQWCLAGTEAKAVFVCLFVYLFLLLVQYHPSFHLSPSLSPLRLTLSSPLPPSKMFVGGLSWQTSEGEATLLIPCIEAFHLEEFDSSIKLVFISGSAFSGVACIQSIAGGHISGK